MELYFQIVTVTLTVLLGLAVGSFLNVVIYRLPNGMSLALPPSHCTACGYRLRVRDNIPVLSYLLLRGKCRKCGVRISPRYLAVELANALLWLVAVLLFWDVSIPFAVTLCLAFSVFLCIFFIDLSHKIIHDRFQIILLLLGGVACIFDPAYGWIAHLVGGVAGFLTFFLLAVIFSRIYGREALGGGDVKLAGTAGLLLGWERLVFALLVASLTASVWMLTLRAVRSRTHSGEENAEDDSTFPFGPFLVCAFTLALLFGDKIVTLYLSLFGL